MSNFSDLEDDYLRVKFTRGEKKISLLAYRLKRPYQDVKVRLVELELLDKRELRKTKFFTEDEIEHQQLLEGKSQEEIREIRMSRRAMPNINGNSNSESDE